MIHIAQQVLPFTNIADPLAFKTDLNQKNTFPLFSGRILINIEMLITLIGTLLVYLTLECPLNCSNCVSTNCLDCSYGFYLNSNNCLPCQSPCADCLSTSFCLECGLMKGRGLNSLNGTCESCSQNTCYDCHLNYEKCHNCKEEFGVNLVTGKCEDCSDPFCLVCNLDKFICTSCIQDGFYGFNSYGQCQECIYDCKTCKSSNFDLCTSCKDGMFYSDPGTCSLCDVSCLTCVDTPTQCTSCVEEKWVKKIETGVECMDCPLFCTQCVSISVKEDTICTECDIESEFDDSTPIRCREICGDSYTKHHLCDNEVGVPFDGCDDDCHVMPGFICKVNINGTTKCFYDDYINMSLISWDIVEEENRFILQTKVIGPLLNDFFILDPHELSQNFEFVNSNIDLTSIKFDPISHILTFEANYFENLVFKTIDIAFVQPGLDKKINVFQIDYGMKPPFYYSQIIKKFSRIVFCLCIFICFLGWFGFFLGLFMKCLQGLETMWVLQFSWLIFLWVKFPFMKTFSEFYPLKFSSGYNLSIYPIDQVCLKAPYVFYFNLNNSSLLGNWNIFIASLVFPLILNIIMKIRFSILFLSFANQNNNEIIDLAVKAENNYETSIQILMSFSMFNLVYFCSSLILYFGQQNFEVDPWSISVASLTAIPILYALYNFLANPDSFGYFRYSFKLKFFAVNHYFFHFTILILTVCFLGLLPNYPESPIVPLLSMTLYTLVYQPYKFTRDNFRSAFNYITMCSFVVTKILIEELEREWSKYYLVIFSSMGLNIVLLSTSVAIGNIFIIASYICKNVEKVEELISGIENSGTMSILKDLVKEKVDEKMKRKEKKSVFTMTIPPEKSIRKFSNELKEENNKTSLLGYFANTPRSLNIKECEFSSKESKRLKETEKQLRIDSKINKKNEYHFSDDKPYRFEIVNFEIFEENQTHYVSPKQNTFEDKPDEENSKEGKKKFEEWMLRQEEENNKKAQNLRKVLIEENKFVNFSSAVDLSNSLAESIDPLGKRTLVEIYNHI